MKKTKFYIIITLFVTLIIPSLVFAEEFNPSYILSDGDLTNWNSMNISDLESFLQSKNSGLKDMFLADVDGIQKKAVEIIYNAARINRINPKVILVLLQKEQSLITYQFPTIKQLDWATGYALCDSCDPNDPNLAKYKGFAIQIDNAAGLFRYYLDHSSEKQWIKRVGVNYTIDNIIINPITAATAFLYTYTPHIEGNKNFWRIWREWFRGQKYPDGVLLKLANDTRIWYVSNSARRQIETENVLRSYFGDQAIITVDTADLELLPESLPLKFPNHTVLHISEDDRYYLNVDETLFPFASKEVLRAIGINPLEIIEANKSDIVNYERGTFITIKSVFPTGAVLKTRKNGKLYYVQNGIKFPINDPALLVTNFKSVKPAIVNDTAIADYIDGEQLLIKDGSVVGIKGTPEIYLVSGGQLRHISTEQIFYGLNYKWDDVVWISKETALLHTKGEPINFAEQINTSIKAVSN